MNHAGKIIDPRTIAVLSALTRKTVLGVATKCFYFDKQPDKFCRCMAAHRAADDSAQKEAHTCFPDKQPHDNQGAFRRLDTDHNGHGVERKPSHHNE